MEDTIAAISTALGVGAISIIRVSGNDAIKIANKITKSVDLEKVNSHTVHYTHIIYNGEIIDEVLVTIMKNPRTFTRENIIEINCHGGIATTRKILEILLLSGCRLAEPGEFTKRAFLNGRIDLLKAESIMDLISSKTEKTRKLAITQLQGKVTKMIQNIRQKVLEILANINVNIDYPEYEDIEEVTLNNMKPKINEIENDLNKILKESENGKLIKEGIKTSIIGRPNVGKSSLLNCLLEEEKAIVTEIEGTTRDIVEGTITIEGIILNIIDTAGIRETKDIIEQIGVEKSKKLIEESDLILYVVNQNDIINDEDKILINKIINKNHIIIINKIDLENKIKKEDIKSSNIIEISTIKNKGIEELKNKIKEIFNLEQLENKDYTYLTNARSLALLKTSLQIIVDIKKGIETNQTIDMIEIDLKNLWNKLGEIIGETYQDELIDQLFSQFCLGK